MKRMGFFLPLVAAALMVSGCGAASAPIASAGSTPVDTEQIAAGADVAISRAFDALELATTAVDVLVAVKVVKPKTEIALTIATGLHDTRTWLNTARSAQKLVLKPNYLFALNQAAIAMAKVQGALVRVSGAAP